MKLKYLAITITFLFTTVFANSDFQKDKTSLLCSGKWYMSYMEAGDMKMPVPEEQRANMWMNFFKDGKHQVNTQGKIKKGLWKFSKNKDSLIFTTEKGEKKSMKLKGLTKTALNLTLTDRGQEVTIYLEKDN